MMPVRQNLFRCTSTPHTIPNGPESICMSLPGICSHLVPTLLSKDPANNANEHENGNFDEDEDSKRFGFGSVDMEL